MIRRRVFLAATSLAALPSFAEAPALTNFRFGILRTVSAGVFEFVSETTRIPRRNKSTGFRFGLGFENPRCIPIEWYEVVHLPEDTKEVSGNFKRARRKTLRTRTLRSDQPSVVDDFWFDEGDPLGRHTLELFVNGSLRYRVDFDVVEDK